MDRPPWRSVMAGIMIQFITERRALVMTMLSENYRQAMGQGRPERAGVRQDVAADWMEAGKSAGTGAYRSGLLAGNGANGNGGVSE
jgi:hypothetical protein